MMRRFFKLLVAVWLCGSAVNSSRKIHTRTKQHNLFNMKGVQIPKIISNTTLSGKKNQLTLLSMSMTASSSSSSTFPKRSSDWFFSSVQNIPKFVMESHEQQQAATDTNTHTGKTVCQLRLLGLGHYFAFHGRKNNNNNNKARPVYEGGLATVRVKEIGQHMTLPCYYVTGRNQHFVLVDDPHTLTVAVLCDISDTSPLLSLCDTLTSTSTAMKLRLQLYASDVTSFASLSASNSNSSRSSSRTPYIYGLARTTLTKPTPSSLSSSSYLTSAHSLIHEQEDKNHQNHKYETTTTSKANAVCTVQTFKNSISGIYLYLFAAYYLRLGYVVIIYDRFGHHYDFIKVFLDPSPSHPQHAQAQGQLLYHAYTALQLALPHIYTPQYASEQNEDYVQYFARHIDDKSKQTAMTETERMTQDQDKRRTYDMARLTYSQIQSMLFVDSDELLFCPPPPAPSASPPSLSSSPLSSSPWSQQQQQQGAHRRLIQTAIADGYDEIQVPRVSQFARKSIDQHDSSSSSSFANSYAATNTAMTCMQEAYYQHNKSLTSLFQCWSTAHLVDKKVNPKSIDIASRCPFRYNHYSCAIHKAYHREKYRCHCNIKTVDVNECRVVHLNNKFLSSYMDLTSTSTLMTEHDLASSSLGGGSLSTPLSDMIDL